MKNKVKINKIGDLTKDLTNLYEQCRENKIEPAQAVHMAGVASKVMKSVALKLMYNKQMNQKNKIPFLED